MDKFEYTQENLRKLQLIELETLKVFDAICRKYSINYIIDAGTLLGAVRHGGFIPWDDDIDIRMLRNEYEKFCEVCQNEFGEKYFLQTYKTDPEYRWGYARILKNGTEYRRANHDEIKSKTGIFIDIFPNDNLPDAYLGRMLCNVGSWLCRKMLYSQVGRNQATKITSRLGFAFLDIFPKDWAHKIREYLVRKYEDEPVEKVRCLAWGDRKETLGFQKEWFEETCDIEFEGLMVKAPVKTHEFLVHSFGEDYMTPPPESERVPRHLATYIKFD